MVFSLKTAGWPIRNGREKVELGEMLQAASLQVLERSRLYQVAFKRQLCWQRRRFPQRMYNTRRYHFECNPALVQLINDVLIFPGNNLSLELHRGGQLAAVLGKLIGNQSKTDDFFIVRKLR